MATINVIRTNYGGSQWLHTITSPKSIKKKSMGYRPDFDKIATAYYRVRVMIKYIETVNSGNDFTKIVLSRECKAESPRDDYFALLYLCNVDIVYQMFKFMRKMYYQNFSWETISQQTATARSNQIIGEMRDIISSKDRTISELNRRLSAIDAINNKTLDSSRISELKETNRLLDIIKQKEQEISELKKRIQYQNELIDAFNKEESEDIDISVDLEALQLKRYLFVGHT